MPRTAVTNGLAQPLGLTSEKRKYFIYLFLACLVSFLIVFLPVILKGRSFVWSVDGVKLYFNFFVYTGEWIREVFFSLLSGQFVVPQFSYDLGFGYDIPVALANFFFDPLNWVSAFCPREYAEYIYEITIFAHYYLAAVTFSIFCFSRGKKKGFVLAGALCYVLSGFVVSLGLFYHPYFICVAIVFPLVLLGADKVFAKKSPALLVLSMGFLFAFSVYWSYMVCILLFFYCLANYFFYPRERSAGDFLLLVTKFIALLLLAFILAGIASVPNFLGLLSLSRIGVERAVSLFNSQWYCETLGMSLIWGIVPKAARHIGAIGVLAILAAIAGFRRAPRGDRGFLCASLAFCIFGLLSDFVGSAFNGFGYSTDRWQFAFCFVAAFALVVVLPLLKRFNKKEWLIFLGMNVAFLLWCIMGCWGRINLPAKIALAIYVIALASLCAYPSVQRLISGRCAMLKRVPLALLSLLVILSCGLPAAFSNTHKAADHVSGFIIAGDVNAYTTEIPLLDDLSEIDLDYRIDRPHTPHTMRNLGFSVGYKGMDAFSSMYNSNLDYFRQEMGISDGGSNYIFLGVDNRFALDAILGAKYYAARTGAQMPPYGYHEYIDLGTNKFGDNYTLYETEYALPLAFTYQSAISEDDYRKLNIIEKQEALTEAAVLAGMQESDLQPVVETKSENPKISEEKDLVVYDGKIVVLEDGATMRIDVEGQKDSENYVCFEGVVFRPTTAQNAAAAKRRFDNGDFSSYEDLINSSGATSSKITAESMEAKRSFTILTPGSIQFGGWENWVLNMGFAKTPVTSYLVTFQKTGVYSYNDFFVASQEMKSIEDNLKKLQVENDASIDFKTNRMDIDVAAAGKDGDGERYLFVSIPYDQGWTAHVDGVETPIQKVNGWFMGMVLNDDAHEVVFSYVTPGFKLGVVLTAIGVLVFAMLVVCPRRRRSGTYGKRR